MPLSSTVVAKEVESAVRVTGRCSATVKACRIYFNTEISDYEMKETITNLGS